MSKISTTNKKNNFGFTTTDRETNFGFGKLTVEDQIALELLRVEICQQMEQYEALLGFDDFDEMVRTLGMIAVNVCRSYASADKVKSNPERFENFVKLVLSDILEKMAA